MSRYRRSVPRSRSGAVDAVAALDPDGHGPVDHPRPGVPDGGGAGRTGKRTPPGGRVFEDGSVIRRTRIPHRNPTPEPASSAPLGLWTVPGSFTSYKTGGIVHYWGDLQLRFLTLMEADRAVLSMRARPEAIRWHDGHAWREHVPSFLVRRADGEAIVDVVPTRRRVSSSKVFELYSVGRALGAQGRRFDVFPERLIDRQPQLDNAGLICRCAGERVPEADRNLVLDAVGRGRSPRLDDVARISGLPYGRCLAAVLNLVWRRILSLPDDRPFGPTTPVGRVP